MLFFLGCVLVPAGVDAAAPDDGRRVARLIENAGDLLNGLEAHRAVAPDDPDLSGVRTIIQEISVIAPADPYLIFLHARYMVLTGLAGDASRKLREFVETRQGQTEWRAFRLLGDLYLDEFPSLAKSSYKKAAALSPGEAGVLFGLSVCEMKLGAIEAAVQLARGAVAADGRAAIRYVAHLARALQADEKWDEALREAENALLMARRETERDPVARRPLESLSAQYTLVMSILRSRIAAQIDDSVNDFLRLDTCVRQQFRVREKLTLHDWLAVVESRVKSSGPDTPLALLQLYGRLLSDVGRTEDAIGTLERVVKLDPDNAEAEKTLVRLRKTASNRL